MAVTPGRAGRLGRIGPARVDGLTEAKANLATVPKAVRESFAEMFRGMGIQIEEMARAKAPVALVDGGQLKASIGRNTRPDGLQVAVGSGIDYAKFVEFGTVDTPKQPFLYPAFRTTVRGFRQGLKLVEQNIKTKVRRGYKGPKR